MEEQIDAKENSSDSAIGEAIAATPEVQQEAQEQVTESVSEKTEAPEQVPFNEHPRFKELIEERNWYRQQLERQQVQPQPQQPTTDPYASMTPEEERFWRAVDQRAERIAEAKIQKVNPMLEAGVRELTNMKVQQFREAHKDIKANSPEEMAIAQKIQMGYLPEDAYKAVMWDSKVAEAEKQGNNNIKQKMEIKKQANVEQKSIPEGVNTHTKEKLTLRQRIERDAKDMEL